MRYEEILKIGSKKYLSCGNYSHNLCFDCGAINTYFWCLERSFLMINNKRRQNEREKTLHHRRCSWRV